MTLYNVEFQEVTEKRTKAQNEWNDINKTLTEALREASTKAFEKGVITEEEREQFFISGMVKGASLI